MLDRRSFIKFIGSAAAAWLAVPGVDAKTFDDLVVNRTFGFAFKKPTSWTWLDVKQTVQASAEQTFDLSNETVRETLKKAIEPYVVAASDPGYPNPKQVAAAMALAIYPGTEEDEILKLRFSSATTLDGKPAGLTVEHDLIDWLEGDIEQLKGLGLRVDVIKGPEAIDVAGEKGAVYEAMVTQPSQNLNEGEECTRATTLMLQRYPLIFVWRLQDSPRDGIDASADIQGIIDSIRLIDTST